MKLYEIPPELERLLNELSEKTDEAEVQEVERQLTIVHQALQTQAENVIRFIVNQDAEADALTEEISRLKAMKDSRLNSVKKVKDYLKTVMSEAGMDKIDTLMGKIRLQTAQPSVDVVDETLIPDEYKNVQVVRTVDKDRIKEAYERGIGVEGTQVVRNQFIKIYRGKAQ